MRDRRDLALGALMTLFVAVGIGVVILVCGAIDDDSPVADGVDAFEEPVSTSEPPASDDSAPTTTAPPAERLANPPPVAVLVDVDGRLERWHPDGTVEVISAALPDGRLVAMTANGDLAFAISSPERGLERIDINRASGAVEASPLDFARSWIVNVDNTDGNAVLEIATFDETAETGDLWLFDVGSGTLELGTAGAVFIDQNTLPVARAAGVSVLEYTWVGEYQLFIDDAAGTTLPSPTDGRYGAGYGADAHPWCIGWDLQRRDLVGGVVLDRPGARLAWENLVVEAADDFEGGSGVVSRELRVLRLADGEDGAVSAPQLLLGLVGLSQSTGVFENGFVDLVTGEVTLLEPSGFIFAIDPASGSDESAVVPTAPVSDPACRRATLSIYGLGDLRAGEEAGPALDDFFSRETSPSCHRSVMEVGGEVWVATSAAGQVRAVSVDEGISTPSGFGSGSTVEDVWARFSDRLEVVPAGVDPSTDPGLVEALDFVPNDPAESHLGLRFEFADGKVARMTGGERELTRGEWPCAS